MVSETIDTQTLKGPYIAEARRENRASRQLHERQFGPCDKWSRFIKSTRHSIRVAW